MHSCFYFNHQVECKKAQPKEVMAPTNPLARGRGITRGALGQYSLTFTQ